MNYFKVYLLKKVLFVWETLSPSILNSEFLLKNQPKSYGHSLVAVSYFFFVVIRFSFYFFPF